MQAILQHPYARQFFRSAGSHRCILTSPDARLRHDDCVICLEPLRSQHPDDQQILLTYPCMETLHADCLLNSLTVNPHRCPYCRVGITHRNSNADNMDQFGDLTLDEPDRDTFIDVQEAIVSLRQYSNILNALLDIYHTERGLIFILDDQQDANAPLTNRVLQQRWQRDIMRAIEVDQLRFDRDAKDMLIAALYTDSEFDISWLSRINLFQDMQELFNSHLRDTFGSTIDTFLSIQ